MPDIGCWQYKFKPCVYSSELIKKLLIINQQVSNKIDLAEIKKAIYYAKKYHLDQKRDSGEPYYSHPLAVASMVANHIFHTDILVTSILHDTLEDTELTKKMINEIFGLEIANNVEELTRKKLYHKISSKEIIKLLCQQGKQDLLLIKCYDRVHNIQTIQVKSLEKIKETILETLEIFIILSLYLQKEFLRMPTTRISYDALIAARNELGYTISKLLNNESQFFLLAIKQKIVYDRSILVNEIENLPDVYQRLISIASDFALISKKQYHYTDKFDNINLLH